VLTLIALIVAFLFLSSPWSWLLVLGAAVVDVLETAVLWWLSKRRRSAVGVEALVGRSAVVVTALTPRGQVRVDGEIWEAESPVSVERGVEVVVRAVRGLALDVEPAAPPTRTL
jgi:membrane-bound serine protease (ClpP class)